MMKGMALYTVKQLVLLYQVPSLRLLYFIYFSIIVNQ